MGRRDAHQYSWHCGIQWTCSEYQNGTYSGDNTTLETIGEQCSTYTYPSNKENYNGRGANYYYRAYCTGHRKRNDNNLPIQPQQNFNQTIATAYTINTLRDMIDSEIDNRRKHMYYNGEHSINVEIDDVSNNNILKNNKNRGNVIEITYPNAMNAVLKNLLSVCKTIYSYKNTNDYNKMDTSITNLTNVNEGEIIKGKTGDDIQNAINNAVKDCICYSDCNNFGVCNCYGYCKCNY